MYMQVTISNKLVEIHQQDQPPLINRTSSGGRKSNYTMNSAEYETNKKVGINRARRKIRQLLECNFPNEYTFLTLTFDPKLPFDTTNMGLCNKKFQDFKKRLYHYLNKLNLPPFKYIGVIEFNGHGSVHYHFICNLISLNKKTIEELWQNGYIALEHVYSTPLDNAKITNYLKKGIGDPRLNGKKKYLPSQNLKKPITITVDNPEDFFDHLNQFEYTPLDGYTFPTRFNGDVRYQAYYINKEKEFLQYAEEFNRLS